ncbi:hypothetical protein C8R46DRAFT_1037807 [Mycena filopes]|nr:hypothetical protein C8R46DRAFT_1037807 [Mycena filopes]
MTAVPVDGTVNSPSKGDGNIKRLLYFKHKTLSSNPLCFPDSERAAAPHVNAYLRAERLANLNAYSWQDHLRLGGGITAGTGLPAEWDYDHYSFFLPPLPSPTFSVMDRHSQALIPSRLAANGGHIQEEEPERREVAVPAECVSATHEASLKPRRRRVLHNPAPVSQSARGEDRTPGDAPQLAHEVVRDAVLAALGAPFWALKADINFKREPSESVPAIWDSLTSRYLPIGYIHT